MSVSVSISIAYFCILTCTRALESQQDDKPDRIISLVEIHATNDGGTQQTRFSQKLSRFRDSDVLDAASKLALKRELFARHRALRSRREEPLTEKKNATHPWTMPKDLSVLVVRVGLGELLPDYCDEKCAFDLMWSNTSTESLHTSHTVSTAIESTSYGKVQVPQSLGQVVTVSLHVDDGSDFIITQCMPWVIAALVQDQLLSKFDIDPTTYSHMVLILPRQMDCAWEGTAWVGCDSSPCKAWVRTDNPMTLFHELGHTLGLHHRDPTHVLRQALNRIELAHRVRTDYLDASVDGCILGLDTNDDGVVEDVYGDGTSIMGHKVYTGFNAAQRAQLGYIGLASVYHLSVVSPGVALTYTLRSIDREPDSRRGFSIIQLPRGMDGGIYHISFNAAQNGIDVNLPSGLAGRVLVHYSLEGDLATRLVAALDTADVFVSTHEGFRVIVKSVNMLNGTATVVLEGAGTSDGDADTKTPSMGTTRRYLSQCSDSVGDAHGNDTFSTSDACFQGSIDGLCHAQRVSFPTAHASCAGKGYRLCSPEEVSHMPVRSCVGTGQLTSDRAAWTHNACGPQPADSNATASRYVSRIGLGWIACVNSSTVLGLEVCCRGGTGTDYTSDIFATNDSTSPPGSEGVLEQRDEGSSSSSAVGIGVCIGLISGLFLWGITTYARAHHGGYLCLTKEQRRAMEVHRQRKQSACDNLLELYCTHG